MQSEGHQTQSDAIRRNRRPVGGHRRAIRRNQTQSDANGGQSDANGGHRRPSVAFTDHQADASLREGQCFPTRR